MAARQQIVIDIQGRASGLTSALKSGQVELAKFNQQVQAATLASANNANATVLLRNAQGQYTTVVKQAKVVVEQLRKEKAAMVAIEQQLTNALTKEEQALLRNAGLMQGMSGAAGSANFAVLSLAQGFQDAGQFGVGAAQGIRAINNNLQQFVTASIFASQAAGGTSKALGLMLKQLAGPAGLLLAFSAVSAGVEYFSNRIQKSKKDAEDAANAYEELAGKLLEFESVGGGTFFLRADQIDDAISAQEKYVAQYESLVKLSDEEAVKRRQANMQIEQNRLLEARRVATAESLGVALDATIEDIELQAYENRKLLGILEQQRASYEAERRLRERLLEIAVQENEELRVTARLLMAIARARAAGGPVGPGDAATPADPSLIGRSGFIDPTTGQVTSFMVPEVKDQIREQAEIQTDALRSVGDTAALTAQYVADTQKDIAQSTSEFIIGTLVRNREAILTTTQLLGSSLGRAGQSFMQLAQIGGEANKRMFAVGKAFAAASAVVNTAQGVTKALATIPPPFSFGVAATIAAAGAAQLAVIKSTTMGSAAGRGGAASGVGQYSSRVGSAPGSISPRVSQAPLLAGIGSGGQQVVIQGEFVQRGRDLVAVVSSETRFQRDVGFNR